jgi:Histidinol-phosphate/aromatic aminotransferase and cobyric acid decarboxylase
MSEIGRIEYRDLRLYAGDTGPCAIDLSDNTNLWGTPPSAAAMLTQAAARGLRGYPEPYSESLKRSIADYTAVPPEQIVTGAGSDDILDCAFRALAAPGDSVAYIAPTFVMAPTFASTNGLRPVPVPLTNSYDANADALLATGARIIYLCSPNNPTGGLLSRDVIEAIVDRAPGFVLVDEAYTDFAGTSVVDLLARSPRLVIARTFSKAFGLAGLRVGYALTSPGVAVEMEKARGPYKVSAVGALAAQLALDEDRAWVRERAALAIDGRETLRSDLAARGMTALPSAANFVFVPFRNAIALASAMRRRSVAVRAFSNLPLAGAELRASDGAALRITVGPPGVMSAALAALDAALSELRSSGEQ